MDYNIIIGQTFVKNNETINTKDNEPVPTLQKQRVEYDLDETFNDDQLIEFSISDSLFEDEYEIENFPSHNIETQLLLKGVLANENIGYKKNNAIESPKNLHPTELLNSDSLDDFNTTFENLSEYEKVEVISHSEKVEVNSHSEKVDVNTHSEDDMLNDSNSNTTLSKLPFQCNLCPKLFKFKHRLIAHKRRHQGLDGYPCTRNKCKRTFNRLTDLRQHINDHDSFPREIYKCDINGCGLEYTTKQAINIHLRKQHNLWSLLSDSKFVCEICGAMLKHARTLEEHQLLHVDKSLWPFKCDVDNCLKRFRTTEHYKEHKNRHDGIKPYTCTHCEKRFCSSSNLSAHVNFHTLEKKWLCRFCPKVVYTPANLRQHIQKQHENNPTATRTIYCRFCNKELSSYTGRKYHEMIHTGEKPYVCEVCGRGFIQPAALKSHNRTHTVEETNKKFNCLLCDRSFATSADLKNHVLKHTGEKPYKCGECGVRFRYQSNLCRHNRQKLCRKNKNLTVLKN